MTFSFFQYHEYVLYFRSFVSVHDFNVCYDVLNLWILEHFFFTSNYQSLYLFTWLYVYSEYHEDSSYKYSINMFDQIQ